MRDDPLENGRDVLTGFGRNGDRVVAGNADDLLELRDRPRDVGVRQVDLVDNGQDLEAVVGR